MLFAFGKYVGPDRVRRACKFEMLCGDATVECLASWELMDALDRGSSLDSPPNREAQFERVRDSLAEIAESKFFSYLAAERSRIIELASKDAQAPRI
jgi:uncharacterized protein DUF1488